MRESAHSYELIVMWGEYAVARLPAAARVPEWVDQGAFWTAARTPDELSIVCEQRLVPSGVRAERDWACLKAVGPLKFSEVGVLATLTAVLADCRISVFVTSTFDTDYILVPGVRLLDAIDALRDAGHVVQF